MMLSGVYKVQCKDRGKDYIGQTAKFMGLYSRATNATAVGDHLN